MLDYYASHGLITDVRRLYATPGLTVPARVLCLSPARGPHEAAVPAQSA